jgi:hypothetical protein
VRDWNRVSFFYMPTTSSSGTICGDVLSSTCFWLLCEIANDCSFYFPILYSVLLIFMSVFCFPLSWMFLLLWFCSIIWSQVLWYFQHCSFCSELFWQFRDFYFSIRISELIFLFFLKKSSIRFASCIWNLCC